MTSAPTYIQAPSAMPVATKIQHLSTFTPITTALFTFPFATPLAADIMLAPQHLVYFFFQESIEAMADRLFHYSHEFSLQLRDELILLARTLDFLQIQLACGYNGHGLTSCGFGVEDLILQDGKAFVYRFA